MRFVIFERTTTHKICLGTPRTYNLLDMGGNAWVGHGVALIPSIRKRFRDSDSIAGFTATTDTTDDTTDDTT